eukprot:5670445-Pyramimonas_sp.AAC.1
MPLCADVVGVLRFCEAAPRSSSPRARRGDGARRVSSTAARWRRADFQVATTDGIEPRSFVPVTSTVFFEPKN